MISWARRAGSLASLGTRRSSIERMLTEQAEDFCNGGKAFAGSTDGKAKVRALALSPRLKIGNARFFKRLKPTWSGTTFIPAPNIPTPREQRHTLMVEIFQGFPPTLPAGDGYTRLQTALDSIGFVLNPTHTHTHEGSEHSEIAGFTGRTRGREDRVDSKRGSKRGSGIPNDTSPQSLAPPLYSEAGRGSGIPEWPDEFVQRQGCTIWRTIKRMATISMVGGAALNTVARHSHSLQDASSNTLGLGCVRSTAKGESQ